MTTGTIPTAHPATPLTADDLKGDRIQPGHPLFGIIWVNRERMSGTPCFAGTRVPVRTLFDYVEGGETVDDFLQGFPGVTREQAIAVIELAAGGLLNDMGAA